MLLQESCCEHDTSKAFSYEISKNKAAELGFCCVVVLLHSKEIQEHLSVVKMLPSYCTILVEDIRHCQQTVIRLSIHTVPLKLFCSCCQLADMEAKSYMNVALVSSFQLIFSVVYILRGKN